MSPDDPLSGTRYRVERLPSGEPTILGTGAVGIVFEAVDTSSGERFAVKVLRPELAAQDATRKRALREAARLAGLAHQCIVKFVESGQTASGLPFIVMERLDGHTLAQHLAEFGPLGQRYAVAVILRVLEGLWFMHSRGVIHRDLKLDNIFLTTEGAVKILDVGLAKELRHHDEERAQSTLTSKGTVIGTPRYTSPEQAAGLRADERSDVYTAAYIFYTLITGHLPFHELDDARDLLLAHAIRPADPPSRHSPGSISPELDAVVLKALEKDPADRYPSAKLFARALYAADRDTPTPDVTALPRAAATSPNPVDASDRSPLLTSGDAAQRIAALTDPSGSQRRLEASTKIWISAAIFCVLVAAIARAVAWAVVHLAR